MSPARIAISILAIALILTNGFWLYRLFDEGISHTYRDVALQEHHEALSQALAILPVAAARNASRQDVIAAATEATQFKDSFEKDGYLWVGRLGLRFGPDDRLVAVEPSWSPF